MAVRDREVVAAGSSGLVAAEGEMTVTGLQSLGCHLDVATRSREFLTAAAASWPSFSHACRRPLSPTPCLVFWLTTYRWHGSLLLLRTGTGAKPRHAEWHAFLSSHGTLLCHACLLCSALPAHRPGRWPSSRRFWIIYFLVSMIQK